MRCLAGEGESKLSLSGCGCVFGFCGGKRGVIAFCVRVISDSFRLCAYDCLYNR